MNTRMGLGLCGLALLVLLAAPLRAASYAVDPVHSSAVFRIAHLNTSYLYGRFDVVSGSFTLDSQDPSKDSFEVTIPVAKLDTNNAMRDNDLKGPDYFSAKEFADITFKSTKVEKVDDTHVNVTGDLTLHGVTKSITIPVEKTGEGKTAMGVRAGVEAIFTIKRSDFGMNYKLDMIGDEVKLMVALEGKQ